MPRMAEKLAGTFVDPRSNPLRASVGEYQIQRPQFVIRSRANSTAVSLRSGSASNVKIALVSELDSEKSDIFDVLQTANMDGVSHLRSKDSSRYIWCCIIILFVVLAAIQIYYQLKLFYSEPVATDIVAEYPATIDFPAIAICNNNHYRLSYITGARIINRRPRSREKGTLKSISGKPRNVFEEVMEKAWDMDAVRFLRSAAHWKSRMILGCTWPNGTSCRMSDFKPVWTLSGLCWALNTDVANPLKVAGSGSSNALRLLLNVETYERIDACTSHFKTRSIPGIKILIYNQTRVPLTTSNGVNIPSGYSMDVRFRMQHHNRLPGKHCITETKEQREAIHQFNSSLNMRTCAIRQTLKAIEDECECSIARAFTDEPFGIRKGCNVDDYFGCVRSVIEKTAAKETTGDCLPACESVEYIAWQDMNVLPQHLMPALIEGHEEDDEEDVEQDDIEEDKYLEITNRTDEKFYQCEEDAYLDPVQVPYIKRNAHRAYEKQARHQEDIFLRTKRRIVRLRASVKSVSEHKWGWHEDDFVGIFERLSANATCFGELSSRHKAIATTLDNRPPPSEERRADEIFFLIDPDLHRLHPKKFKSIADVKRVYGDRVDPALKKLQNVRETIEKMWRLYTPSYLSGIKADLSRMDRIVQMTAQYENGRLQRRAWAEKMQSRRMRHFFEDEFVEGWYHPIILDLENSLYKVIHELEKDYWPKFSKYMEDGSAVKTAAFLFFEDNSLEHQRKLEKFINEMYGCTVGEVKTVAGVMLKDFKRIYRELQASYSNLFNKELPEYLENFEFGTKFVRENFAMVNVFLQQMHLEYWRQNKTYGFWSLACDIGGALGLFLGASMLTIIELVYICYRYQICGKVYKKTDAHVTKCWETGREHLQPCINCCEPMSAKSSYISSGAAEFEDPFEERQKSSWLNPFEGPSPIHSSPRTPDENLDEFLDADDGYPPRYEDALGMSTTTTPTTRQGQSRSPLGSRLSEIPEEDSGLESDIGDRPKARSQQRLPPPPPQKMIPEEAEYLNPPLSLLRRVSSKERRSSSNVPLLEARQQSPLEDEEVSQVSDSLSSAAAPKLFVNGKDRQTTL
ncbi:hypothetical protein Q1695_012841 [Nippostrongylus brasiliensis]|nr:hypothetical protein Q1695_012841 [Nippostrongylus brasiliensis]